MSVFWILASALIIAFLPFFLALALGRGDERGKGG